MALNERRAWLIAYDISESRRLGRVHRYLKGVAMPVQYSVFVAVETKQGIQRIRRELEGLIDARADDIRIYLLPLRPRIAHYGSRVLPRGLLLGQTCEPEGVLRVAGSLVTPPRGG